MNRIRANRKCDEKATPGMDKMKTTKVRKSITQYRENQKKSWSKLKNGMPRKRKLTSQNKVSPEDFN